MSLYSLYLHFPFCLYKCHYCDFNSYAFREGDIPFGSYKQALIAEWRRRLHYFDPFHPISSIFFGGGTPSLMRPADVADILGEICRSASAADDVEVSLEANPKTIDAEKLKGFRRAGINRLSVGIQSLHDAYLSAFGRIHSADDAREALSLVRDAGFKSWNADLIFGFPEQTADEWKKDLHEVLSYRPPHLSCYAFTVEEGTVYSRKVGAIHPPSPTGLRRTGELPLLPDEDRQAEMFELTGEILEQAGYCRYEISNFARPGRECRHNVNYWNYGEYVGLGTGAVSFLRCGEKSPPPPFDKGGKGGFGYRMTNFKEPERYMNALLNNSPHPPLSLRGGERGSYWFDTEEIARETAMGEFMMMGLRLERGVSAENFRRLFGVPLYERYRPSIDRFEGEGWLKDGGRRLTKTGRLFSNQIMGAFLA